jgi:hypothetical protein
MAPIEYIGRYMRGWFDFAIGDELHQLAGDTAQGNGLGVLGRAAKRLIALTGTLMGGYADDLFNIFYRMEPHAMVREGFAYGGQGRRDFQGSTASSKPSRSWKRQTTPAPGRPRRRSGFCASPEHRRCSSASS